MLATNLTTDAMVQSEDSHYYTLYIGYIFRSKLIDIKLCFY